jgi:hypothetical protein
MDKEPQKELRIAFPFLLRKLGLWPLNVGLFFLYNTIINIVISIVAAVIFTRAGTTDAATIANKTEGIAIIGILLTLGLTIIFKKQFYASTAIHEKEDGEGMHASDATTTKPDAE